WKKVFAKIGRKRLGIFVVHHPFEQGVSYPVDHAANNLAFNDHRINQAPTVADHHVPHDTDRSYSGVDLDLDAVTGITVSETSRHEVGRLLKTRLDIFRQRVTRNSDRFTSEIAK